MRAAFPLTAAFLLIAAITLTACENVPEPVPGTTPGATSSEAAANAADGTVSMTKAVTVTEAVIETAAETSEVIDNEWAFFLINVNNPLPSGYVPELGDIGGGFKVDKRCAEYALSMFKAAAGDGLTLNIASAYRSVDRQKSNFRNSYDDLLSKGYSREDAYAVTASNIAPPYASEHNAGLAIDLGFVDESFENTAEYRWLIDNSYKFGFIMRYPKEKSDITGIIYEPWHFRFVGLYHAKEIYGSGLCLEEYMGDDGKNNDVDGIVFAFKREILSTESGEY